MITIYLNTTKMEVENNHSLMDVLTSNGHTANYFAVAVNRKFIPRSLYQITYFQEGDVIEIVAPMQGG